MSIRRWFRKSQTDESAGQPPAEAASESVHDGHGGGDYPLGVDDIDLWAMRDQGYVRSTDIPELEARLASEARGQIVADYEVEPSEQQKLAVIARYEELAEYLNAKQLQGRSDWTPRHAWGVGRAAVAIQWGVNPEEICLPVPWDSVEGVGVVEHTERGQSSSLQEYVERWLPEKGEAEQPQWTILAMPGNSAAPIITISRDPRSGPRLVPVFFVGVADEEALLSLGSGLYQGTGHVARLFHTAFVEPGQGFLIIPALYHMVDVRDFSRVLREYLESQALRGMEFQEECCEVLINHEGNSYTALRGTDEAIEIVTTQWSIDVSKRP